MRGELELPYAASRREEDWTASGGMRTFPPLVEKPRRHFPFAAALLMLVAAPLAPVGAGEKLPPRHLIEAPPPAMPQRVNVARSGTVEISLRIFGRQNEVLRYLIKAPPAYGRLSEVREVGSEVSTVTYEPPVDLAITADHFTFSVQNHAGVSAPVDVVIAIIDEKPRLAVENTLDFGELLAGTTATQEIEVANRGGGVAVGDLLIDPPFKVEGRTHYELNKGDYTYFKVSFVPTEGGQFRRELRYSSDADFVTVLIGNAQAPISAEPPTVVLQHEVNSPVRTGSFEIVNRTDQAREFNILGGPRLEAPKSVKVEANGRSAIVISTAPNDVLDLDTEVRVESTGFALRVPVQAAKLGPILHFTQQRLAVGRVDAAHGGQTNVVVQNVGGTATSVTGDIAAPFALPQAGFEIMPGESHTLPLTIQSGEVGRYRTWLKLTDGTVTAELEVEAELVAEMGANHPDNNPLASVDLRATGPAKPATHEIPPWSPDMDVAKDIRVSILTPTSAQLEWPTVLNTSNRFRIERLMLTRDTSHQLRNAWVEFPKATFDLRGTQWTARLSGLEPLQSQTVRVVPIDPEGHAGATLFALDFFTPGRPAAVQKPHAATLFFVVLIAAFGVYIWKKIKRPLSDPVGGF